MFCDKVLRSAKADERNQRVGWRVIGRIGAGAGTEKNYLAASSPRVEGRKQKMTSQERGVRVCVEREEGREARHGALSAEPSV